MDERPVLEREWEQGTPVEVPWRTLSDYQCFGCSPQNTTGLALEFRRTARGFTARLELERRFESYPGVVHGGVVGAVCDEVMGNALSVASGSCVLTTTLRVRYMDSLSVGRTYWCVAESARPTGDGPGTRMRAEVLDARGAAVASAVADYRPIPLDEHRVRAGLTEAEAHRIGTAFATTAEPR
ncbi:hotdog domain-containing protein [Streptomyces sp. NRRL F-5630]|uniref:hotdog domain-containing protein n=1 Tax=Streptomyces sp. NRRL F-5630 TaxID=1463864 RepID=UPI000B0EC55A